MAASVTGEIIDFVCSSNRSALDGAVLEAARRSWIDCLAAAFAGLATPAAAQARGFARACGGSEEATVLGATRRAPVVHAALANGVIAHAVDYDDTSWTLFGHPTAVVLPVVLALAERCEATGMQALAAYAIGVEVSCKLGRLLCPPHYEHGWHATSTLGVFGATCAAARLLELTPAQLGHALGLAAAQSGGLARNFGSMAKPFQVGQAARNAVTAALLAEAGMSGGADILDGPGGYLEVYAGRPQGGSGGGAGVVREPRLGEVLGAPFDLVAPGFALKMYPTCAFTHCAIDAALALRRRHRLAAAEVAEVACLVNPLAPAILIHHAPRTALEGKFSMEFCLAAALCFGEVGPAQVTDEVVRSAAVRDLMRRITMLPSEELAGEEAARLSPAQVTITLRSGHVHSRRVLAPYGSAANPASAADLEQKFRQCASLHLAPQDADRCLSLLRGLEKAASLHPLLALCRFGVAS
ncbi:MAG: MmgE/PrpD family protein [Candidatus Tectomicrobia bacterium]|nr:MmgE/PrpD family protein [Candidatus Tectomicrobia bacterium]